MFMKKTVNPNEALKDELSQQEQNYSNTASLVYDNQEVTQCQKYDFMNFPEALPEEVFIYFGNQVGKRDYKTMEEREILLNLHFFKHYHSILEQREEKDVYFANGFTQRNQRGDDQEEKLRHEIISDFNEFEQIQHEASCIIGSDQDNKSNEAIAKLKAKTEKVLRTNISPNKNANDTPVRTISQRYTVDPQDCISPLEVMVQKGRLRRNSDAYQTLKDRLNEPNAFLEEIEEELR